MILTFLVVVFKLCLYTHKDKENQILYKHSVQINPFLNSNLEFQKSDRNVESLKNKSKLLVLKNMLIYVLFQLKVIEKLIMKLIPFHIISSDCIHVFQRILNKSF